MPKPDQKKKEKKNSISNSSIYDSTIIVGGIPFKLIKRIFNNTT